MAKHDIASQIAAMEAVARIMAHVGKDAVHLGLVKSTADTDRIVDGYDAAIRTMRWLAANQKAVKLAYRTINAPEIKAVQDAFPGSTIEGISNYGEADDASFHG